MIGSRKSQQAGKSVGVSLGRCIASGLSVFRTFGLVLVFVACTNKDKVPSDVLPKEKMGKVMFDMIQADRFSSQFLSKDSSKDIRMETFKLYEEVFTLHKITREEFIHSYKFYLSRPDLNKVLFDSLTTWADRRRPEVQKLDSIARKADSIRLKLKPDTTHLKKVETGKKDTTAFKTDSARRRANAALRKSILSKKK
jgi:hypothetical protein